jgi:signal-transduction protein with cAMP-binding, CBS, and nucleotidyltransferase domain
MGIGEICNREVVVVTRETKVVEATRLMREHHVGDVVVVMEQAGRRTPIGVVTDRDIVIEVVAAGLDASFVSIGEIMTSSLASVDENTGVFESIIYMRDKGIRRLPVVDGSGNLIGIVALDDLIELLAEELNELSRLIRHEQDRERKERI